MGTQPNVSEARQLFTQGEIGELVARSDCRPHAVARLSGPHQLILAHALVLNGQPSHAHAIAIRHTSSTASRTDRSRAHTVLALCLQLDGDLSTALFHAEAATVLAEQAGDESRVVWSHLGLLRLQVDNGVGPHLSTQLARAGDLARRSKLAQPLAYFHECVSISEGQQGRLASALRHCETAESLLSQEPNIALQGTLQLNRSCLRYLKGDYEGAFEDLRRASISIPRSGLARNAGALKNNLAHLELITGRLTDARRSFEALSRNRSTSPYIRIGALDGLARTHLANGSLDQCNAELSHLERCVTRTGSTSLYHARWATVTRVRLLLALGQLRKAADRALQIQATASQVDDVHLQGTALLLAARAWHALGHSPEAAQALAMAGDALEKAPQLQGEYCYHAAALVRDEDPSAAQMLEARARFFWSESGGLGLRREVENSEPPGAATHSRTGQQAFSPVAVALACAECLSGADDQRRLDQALSALATGLGVDPTSTGAISHSHPAAALAAFSVRLIARGAEGKPTSTQPPPMPNVSVEGTMPQRSPEMDALHNMAQRIASTDAPVLITGETGTGKDLLARFIHQHSGVSGPFVPFNCAAVARELFDSQLFGHCKGAFTGAGEDFLGVIRAAAGGTLFLDEIGEVGLDLQPKLLRFLESGEVHPVGATQALKVRVRIIAATNANLETMVAGGLFRSDLYYRLGIVRLKLPPLRERRGEILPLARHYLKEFGAQYERGTLALDDDAAVSLENCDWPGNIRQLVSEMRRVAALADADSQTIGTTLLSPEIQCINQRPSTSAPEDVTEVSLNQPLKAAVETLERNQVKYALDVCRGHVGRTAKMLGLSRKGLYLKRRRYKL